MTIKGIIFDFDGLILDTEEPIFQSWAEVYERYGQKLSLAWWGTIIGSAEAFFDPGGELERQLGYALDWEAIEAERLRCEQEMIAQQAPLPGVVEALEEAKALELKVALASSSSCAWVTGHLEHLGLIHYFDAIIASDDVRRTKPDPELFLSALKAVELNAQEAIVLEDSPNGVLAARRAGIFVVAVPNVLTREMNFETADLRLNSLADISIADLISLVEATRKGP
jgi:HAD superfamily hydrolase (TIGR01509 family)